VAKDVLDEDMGGFVVDDGGVSGVAYVVGAPSVLNGSGGRGEPLASAFGLLDPVRRTIAAITLAG
jgi:hypothetical protein